MIKNILAPALALFLLGTPEAFAQDQSIAEREKIERIIEEYLLEKPEIIETAIIELNRRRTLAKMLPSIQLYRGYLENDPDSAVLGNPDGDVTVVEFFDYRCGFCRRHFGEVLKLVEQDKNIRWVPRHYPILDRPNEKPVSMLAARAAEAAHKQGKFREFHIALMTSEGNITEEKLYETAASVGLDVTQLKADMNDKLLQKRIGNSLAVGHDIGFTGTPGYIIGDDVILGAEGYPRLVEAVNRARNSAENSR